MHQTLRIPIMTFLLPILFLLGISSWEANGQERTQNASDSLVILNSFNEPIGDFEVDNLGNLYLFGARQQLKKLSPTFDSLAVFNDTRHFGKLYMLDASNPLRIILFYRDFGAIIILDRFLNVRTILNLRTAGYQQVSAIAQSYDNNIWLYDELENMIKKIDEGGNTLTSSPDFRVLFDDPPQPQALHDFNRYLYASDSEKGLVVMDYFGAVKNKISFKGWHNLHSAGNGIVATDSTGLVYFQPGSPVTKNKPLPAWMLSAKKIRVQQDKLYVLDNEGRMGIYRFPGN
jgi:hypothetical protein